jgi:hypothetical protein
MVDVMSTHATILSVSCGADSTAMLLLALERGVEIERLVEWEALVAKACKMGRSSFFAVNKIPGANQVDHSLPMPGVLEAVRLAMIWRGGWDYDLFAAEVAEGCMSRYWLCDAGIGERGEA